MRAWPIISARTCTSSGGAGTVLLCVRRAVLRAAVCRACWLTHHYRWRWSDSARWGQSRSRSDGGCRARIRMLCKGAKAASQVQARQQSAANVSARGARASTIAAGPPKRQRLNRLRGSAKGATTSCPATSPLRANGAPTADRPAADGSRARCGGAAKVIAVASLRRFALRQDLPRALLLRQLLARVLRSDAAEPALRLAAPAVLLRLVCQRLAARPRLFVRPVSLHCAAAQPSAVVGNLLLL